MKYQKLGQTELMVSAVSMGGIAIQRVETPEAKKVVSAAIENGINFFDTARGYTDSEEKLGEALQPYRDKIYIATKSMARQAAEMTKDIDYSLKLLKTDYIDIYQLHNIKDDQSLEKVLAPGGALGALKAAQQAGKVRFIGITGHIPEILVKALKTDEFATAQFPYNPVETLAESELMPLAEAMNIGTIAMKPFAGGAIRANALALKFILGKGINTAIPGMDSEQQVLDNISAVEAEYHLSTEDLQLLAEEVKELGASFCRRCDYCQPCPQGIDIPTVFLLEGYWSRYGLKEWAVNRYAALKNKVSNCMQCGICESKCPYQLPIIKNLKAASDKLTQQ